MEDSTEQEKLICIRVLVSGKVQGVGYRFSTLQQARRLGLSGWVRNLPNGQVEALFEGDRPLVEQMIRWCRLGPTAAVVEDVVVKQVETTGIKGFEIKY